MEPGGSCSSLQVQAMPLMLENPLLLRLFPSGFHMPVLGSGEGRENKTDNVHLGFSPAGWVLIQILVNRQWIIDTLGKGHWEERLGSVCVHVCGVIWKELYIYTIITLWRGKERGGEEGGEERSRCTHSRILVIYHWKLGPKKIGPPWTRHWGGCFDPHILSPSSPVREVWADCFTVQALIC